MGEIDVDPQLIGSLAETYYKEYCDQKGGWAYTSVENISNKFENDTLDFKLGFNRFKIKIPSQIVPEIKQISQASYRGNDTTNPSFVFDFLSCKIYDGEEIQPIITSKKVEHFRWVEVKSSGSKISPNQHEKITQVKLPFTLCVVYNVKKTPYDVGLKFYYDKIPDSMFKQ